MAEFDGKSFLVTGAARGQGAEFASRLAQAGANVLICDLDAAEGQALAARLGPGARFHRLDVSSEADWAALGPVVDDLGGLDGLVNNAGIYRPATVAETRAADVVAQMMVNQLGTALGIQFAATHPAPQGASVVNISSLAGLKASKGLGYVGSKWAVRGMTKAAALELAGQGIRVNSIHPGIIETDMIRAWSDEDRAQRVAKIPLGRIGQSADIAEMVLFLLSPRSSFMTGAEIAIDGGASL